MAYEDDDVDWLLAQVRAGDAAAIKALYLRCAVVFAHVLRLCGDPVLAREVHHDTVTEIWKGRAPFRHEAKFSSWVIGIARRLAFQAIKSRSREPAPPAHDSSEALEDGENGGECAGDPAGALAERQRRAAVQCCIAKLPPQLGECLLLVYYAEMSQSEVAGLLGMNPNTVKSRVREAHRRITQCLKRLLH